MHRNVVKEIIRNYQKEKTISYSLINSTKESKAKLELLHYQNAKGIHFVNATSGLELYNRGVELYTLGQYEEAIEFFDTAALALLYWNPYYDFIDNGSYLAFLQQLKLGIG